MKEHRKRLIILATFSIILFSVSSLTKARVNTSIQKYGTFYYGCALGTLNETHCDIIMTPFGRCTVTKGIETVSAYNNIFLGTCIEPLFKQYP